MTTNNIIIVLIILIIIGVAALIFNALWPRPTIQLRAVRAARYERKQIMNNSERYLFDVLRCVFSQNYFVCPQVALGEALQATTQQAFYAINCKRCDFLVIDQEGWPVAAIEYQGKGHWMSKDAPTRDNIKRYALEDAGIIYIEVFSRNFTGMKTEIIEALRTKKATR